MRVVVTGATGNVGTAVVRALVADPAVDEVVGVARRSPDRAAGRVRWLRADVSRDELGPVVAGADAVIHLAWKLQPQHRLDELTATNVDGTRRLVDAVVEAGVPALVVASSVGTYAPGPKEPPVDESWPATGVATSGYSRHKAAVESLLDGVERSGAPVRIVRMRTSLVFQRAAASEIARIFVGPWVPRRVPSPFRLVPAVDGLALQATHADDVADAYRLAVHSTERGAFNVAADGVLDPATLAELVEGRALPAPAALLRGLMSVSYRLRLQRSEPGWLDLARRTPLMDSSRARSVLGWRPRHSAADAFRDLLAGLATGAGTSTAPLHPGRGGQLVD